MMVSTRLFKKVPLYGRGLGMGPGLSYILDQNFPSKEPVAVSRRTGTKALTQASATGSGNVI